MSVRHVVGTLHKRVLKQMLLRLQLHEFLKNELPVIAGYVGLDLSPLSEGGYQLKIYAKNPGIVIGPKGRRARELIRKIAERFKLENIRINVEEVKDASLNAQLLAEEIARAILRGVSIRRVAYSVMNKVMQEGALGVEIRIKGKLQKRRAKKYRFAKGMLIHSGDPAYKYVDVGRASILVKTGVIGVRVTIVKPIAKLPDRIAVKSLEEVGGDIEKFKQLVEEEAKKAFITLEEVRGEAEILEEGEE
ncbi:MAG: 30S ribosomal protein S3 [Candidatus Njordarchaeales archaeon]